MQRTHSKRVDSSGWPTSSRETPLEMRQRSLMPVTPLPSAIGHTTGIRPTRRGAEFALSVFADDLGNSEVRSKSVLGLGVFLTTRFARLRHLPSGSVSLQDRS